jgi:hypothetical protein
MTDLWSRVSNAIAWRVRAFRIDLWFFPVRLRAWLIFRRTAARYRFLTEGEIRQTRRSDTVFIFGSGYSLNELSPQEWREIAHHDTLGFNWFVHQRFVRCDYQLVREIGPSDLDETTWRQYLQDYFERLLSNPCFKDTVLLIQTGFRATNGNRAIGLGLIPSGRRIFLWRSLQNRDAPSLSLRRGLAHGQGTLSECINFAFLMGWTTIVLVGVDLYDRRYFWLRRDEPRPDDPQIDLPHNTVAGGVVESVGRWRDQLAARDVHLFVYNPRSLLAGVLPVWPARA